MAVTIEFRFPGGRYHATPAGHHVNEGLMEWPPSPWRLLRTFIATAFCKMRVPDPVPDDHPLRSLIRRLAETLPEYRLPRAVVTTHSRHYMPLGRIEKGREKTTLILDASAVLGREALWVRWPLQLTDEEAGFLGELVPRIGYLGRAESWVEARILFPEESEATDAWVVPATDGTVPGKGWSLVALTAAVPEPQYLGWKEQMLGRALEELRQSSEPKKPTKKQIATVQSAYPADLFACLLQDSATVQKQGWNQAPGSRQVFYLRPDESLAVTPPIRKTMRSKPAPVEAALLALSSDQYRSELFPLYSRCLPQADILHKALISVAARGKTVHLPELTGKAMDGKPLVGHRHLHILPLSIDAPGFLDHFLLWAPCGLSVEAIDAIGSVRRTWAKNLDGSLSLEVCGIGSLQEFAAAIPQIRSLLGPSKVFRSITPFVPPRYLKSRKHTLVDQVQAELQSRGLPTADVQVMNRDEFAERKFHRFLRCRQDHRKSPPQDLGLGVQLTFQEHCPGPICLGYASHFGLGLFRAE